MDYMVFAFIVGATCLLPLTFGVLSLNGDRRAMVLSRYPLQVVTWVIATPFFFFSLFGTLMGFAVAVNDSQVAGGLFGILGLALATGCVVAVVMCSRAARGKFAKGPWTPAVLGFGAPALLSVFSGAIVGGVNWMGLFTVLLCTGAGVNGLLAVHINQKRRAGTSPVNPDATLPQLVTQAQPASVPAAPVAGAVQPDPSHNAVELPPPPPTPPSDADKPST